MTKKQVLISVLLLILLPTLTMGAIGFGAGVNINSMAMEKNAGDGWGGITSFRIGSSLSWKLSSKLALQPELFLSQTGTQKSFTLLGEKIDVSETYGYLELPILLSYQALTIKQSKINIMAGLYVGYNITAKQKIKSANENYSDSIRSQINKMDFGWLVGLGLIQPVGKGGVTVDLRYSFGIININQPDLLAPKLHNRMVTVILGYRFGH